MAFSATARPSALAEMNVTPLVDVMLVLLIIFMVTAPLLSRPLDLSLPQGTDTPSPDKPSILSLDVAADGTLRLDDRPLPARDLRVRLDDALRSNPKTVLTLSALPRCGLPAGGHRPGRSPGQRDPAGVLARGALIPPVFP